MTGRLSSMVRAAAALVLFLATVGLPPPAKAQNACQFVLGFATLRAMIGAATVGDCLENQRSAANGNAEQRTANGLLAWRKADNWTAFTDGYRTWINGPFGVQQRLNVQRYPWEADSAGFPLANPVTAPIPAPLPTATPTLRVAGTDVVGGVKYTSFTDGSRRVGVTGSPWSFMGRADGSCQDEYSTNAVNYTWYSDGEFSIITFPEGSLSSGATHLRVVRYIPVQDGKILVSSVYRDERTVELGVMPPEHRSYWSLPGARPPIRCLP